MSLVVSVVVPSDLPEVAATADPPAVKNMIVQQRIRARGPRVNGIAVTLHEALCAFCSQSRQISGGGAPLGFE